MPEHMIQLDKPRDWKSFFLQWEWLLVLIFILIHVMNSFLSPYYLNVNTFIRTPQTFLDKAFIVFPMTFIIILGSIDVSVGSTVALSSVIMAVSYNAGMPMGLAMVLCLAVSSLCGLFNGFLLARYHELSSAIVTISTMTIYRGFAYVILEDQAAGGFPGWFESFGWGSVGPVPVMSIAFIVCAGIFGLLLHRTTFGRCVYGMGHNHKACLYSGINIKKIKMIVSMLTGLMAGVTAIFLTSRMGSTRPNVATGYELEVIAMVVLGGVSTAGGKGKMIGPILAVFIVGYLSYGLGLINVSAQVLLIIIGGLLIASVLISNIRFSRKEQKKSSPEQFEVKADDTT